MIYCVEDDASIREIELYTLRATGFSARGLSCARELFEALKEETPQLILLDIMLPDEDGISILRRLKSHAGTAGIPVIMATAKGTEYDKIAGLDAGADDYLTKPFGMMEMVARIRAVLRRFAGGASASCLEADGLRIDLTAHQVTLDGKPLALTLKEFELLRLLMSHTGMAFTREQLLSDIWGMDYDGETRTIDVHIRTLRGKLGRCGHHIETVRGIGYRWEVSSQ